MEEEPEITKYYLFRLGKVNYKFIHFPTRIEFKGPRISQEGLLRPADFDEIKDLEKIGDIFYGDLFERVLTIKKSLEDGYYFGLSEEKLNKSIGDDLEYLSKYKNIPLEIREIHQRKNNIDLKVLKDKLLETKKIES